MKTRLNIWTRAMLMGAVGVGSVHAVASEDVERIIGRDVVRVENGLIKSLRFMPNFSDEPTAVFFGTVGIGPRAALPPVKP